MSDWETGCMVLPIPACDPYPETPGIDHVERKVTQELLAFVIPELSDAHPDVHTLGLVTKTLAHGKESRLYERLFYREQMINSLRIHSYGGNCDGVSIIIIEPRQGADWNHLVSVFFEEMRRMYEEGLPPHEIRKLVNELSLAHRYTFEYMESVAAGLGNEELVSDYRRFMQYPAQLAAITPEQVHQAVRRYFSPGRIQVYSLSRKAPVLRIPEKASRTRLNAPTDNVFDTCLPNGMRLFMKPTPGKGIVAFSACLPVSQMNESPDLRGVNQMVSSLLIHGTNSRDYRSILDTCTSNGIIITVSNHLESTSVLAKCFPEYTSLAVEMLDDILFEPSFPETHFENFRRTYRESLDRIRDYPEQYAQYLWRRMAFGKDCTLLHRKGTKGDLHRMTRSHLVDWHRKHYQPSQITLVVMGDFDPQRMVDLLSFRFANRHDESQESTSRELRLIPAMNRIRFRRTDSDQSVIYLGGFGCPGTDTIRNTAFYVLSHILGGDLYSRLSTELRERMGVAYSCGFDFQAVQDVGYFAATATVDRAQERESLTAIRRILREVAAKPVTATELEMAKNAIRGQRLFEQESVLQQAEMLSMLLTLKFPYLFWLEREKRLQQVTADQIQQLATDYFRADNEFLYILS
jgi:zinc protease